MVITKKWLSLKNGEDNDCPLQILAFLQSTTVDKKPQC